MEIQWKYNGNIMEHKCEQLYNVKVMDSRMKLLDLQWKNSNYNGWKEQFFSCENNCAQKLNNSWDQQMMRRDSGYTTMFEFLAYQKL